MVGTAYGASECTWPFTNGAGGLERGIGSICRAFRHAFGCLGMNVASLPTLCFIVRDADFKIYSRVWSAHAYYMILAGGH